MPARPSVLKVTRSGVDCNEDSSEQMGARVALIARNERPSLLFLRRRTENGLIVKGISKQRAHLSWCSGPDVVFLVGGYHVSLLCANWLPHLHRRYVDSRSIWRTARRPG